MTGPLGHLHALAEVDHCHEEAAHLISQAEERLHAISQASTSECCRLMSAHILKTMRRTQQLMQDHRVNRANQIAVSSVAPPVLQASRWWPFSGRRRAYLQKTL